MAIFQRGEVWWYEFSFAGRRIRESSKSASKTLARTAEKNRKRELEEGFNNVSDNRQQRVRTISDMADDYLAAYKLRHPQSATFAAYAVEHVKRVCGREDVRGLQRSDSHFLPKCKVARERCPENH